MNTKKFRWVAALAVGVVAAGSMTACSASGGSGEVLEPPSFLRDS